MLRKGGIRISDIHKRRKMGAKNSQSMRQLININENIKGCKLVIKFILKLTKNQDFGPTITHLFAAASDEDASKMFTRREDSSNQQQKKSIFNFYDFGTIKKSEFAKLRQRKTENITREQEDRFVVTDGLGQQINASLPPFQFLRAMIELGK